LTSPKGRKASLSMGNAPNYYREDVQLPFDSTDTGVYMVLTSNLGYCFACLCNILNTCTGASANNAAQLSCGSSVTRGQSATCTVINYGNATISNWKFTDGQSQQITITSASGTKAKTW